MPPRKFFGFPQVKLYSSNNSLQVEDVKKTLDKYESQIKLNNIRKIVDIGCGPGDITNNQLLPLVPNDGSVLGIDIAPQMVDYATATYTDPRLSFEVKDFENPTACEKYVSTFDFATSFYVFNMLQNQRTAFENLYKILKKGGETLIIIVTHCSMHTQLEILASNPKWSPYMQGVNEFVSPYLRSTNPETEIINLIRDIGFHVKNSAFELKTHNFQIKEDFLESMLAINAFVGNIPESIVDEYVEEFKQKMWTATANEPKFPYTTFTLYAQKPY